VKTQTANFLFMLLCSCGASSGSGAATASPQLADELRARCERFVTKAEQLGSTEAESTHEQKVGFCVEQHPPTSLMDCVERATTKAEADAC